MQRHDDTGAMRRRRSTCARLAGMLAVISVAMVAAQQQQPAPPSPASAGAPATAPGQQPAVFRSGVRLLVQHVTVKDKAGKPIPGLTAADFALTEENEPQEIAFVEYQQIEGEPGSAPPEPIAADSPPVEAAQAPAPIAQVEIATPPAGTVKYQNRRLLVLYFDQSSMQPADQIRAYDNARKFIDEKMAASDVVAVMTFQSNTLKVRQDFTENRALLRDVVAKLQYGDDLDGDGIADTPDQTDEFNVFNTNRQLSALQSAVALLRNLPERKTLLYFVSGLRLNASDNQAQLRATTNAALKANVTINPIDVRGLTADAPLGNANQAGGGGASMFSGPGRGGSGLEQSQDSLYAIAKDTGGKAMFDNNDLALGIVQAAQAATDYYIVGYYSTHTATDGKQRRVKVTLTGGRQGELAYRPAYYGEKTFAAFTNADKERQLEEAFQLEDPITEITIAMELNYFQLTRAEYYVPVAMKIPGSELTLARRRGAARTTIDFIGEIKDEYGIRIQNIRDHVDIKLSDEDAELIAKRPIQYEAGYTLLPGKYVIKVLARDATTGRIGTYQTQFIVPNLVREASRIPTSSVVLSSQRVPLGDELFAVDKSEAPAESPLVHDGQRLVPSVTRVFGVGKELYVYLEAYQRGAASQQPLVAFVSFYNGEEKAFETDPLPVVSGWHPKSKAVPLKFSVPLAGFSPGRYECQITVLDPAGQKASFWRMPVVLVP